MHKGHQVPKQPEQEPRPSKSSREKEELVAPLHVQERRPEVTEVQGPSAADVFDADVAPSILGEDSASPAELVWPSRFPPTGCRSPTPPRGAQQGLADVRLRLGMAHFLRGGAFGGRRSG